MLFLFYAVAILLFPAGAVLAWRRGGERWLALLTVITVSALVGLALIVASERGGNRLVQTRGYTHTATRTLLFTGLALILPLVASAMSVWATGRRMHPGFVYPIAVATALIGTAVGSIVAIYTLWS
ncbi:MAG TPA: hypothetical protein VNP73_07910 [Actinomycetota bacterium]|nr:hypothetical protein [Actinomycetota bacterium]